MPIVLRQLTQEKKARPVRRARVREVRATPKDENDSSVAYSSHEENGWVVSAVDRAVDGQEMSRRGSHSH
jgi:hypothetical protein